MSWCVRAQSEEIFGIIFALVFVSISLRFVNGIEIEIHFVCSLFSVQIKGKNVVNENFNCVR